MLKKLNYKIAKDLCVITFTAEEEELILTKGADFWRIHLDNDEICELTVFSSAQSGTVEEHDNETVVTYNKLVAENGEEYDITFEAHVVKKNGFLEFYSVTENRANVRVNEVQFPFFQFDQITSDPEDEVLYLPDGLGERIPNIREHVRKTCHTEYMAADYQNIWKVSTYPSGLSMAFMGIQSGDYYLYLERPDEQFRICSFCVGTSPRNTEKKLVLTLSHYPMTKKGEKIRTPSTIAGLYKGDWREGAAHYKAWAEKTWYHPAENPSWVKNMTGWQRIIMKHQYGEIFFRYSDLPKIYEDGAKYGIHTLLVFGWWKGRFDNGYPRFEADPALGGEEELKRNIAKVQKRGGRVILYSNGKLIDTVGDYYKNKGHEVCQIDIDGNEYFDHYKFANNGTVLRNFGYKSFVSGCHATDGWQKNLVDVSKIKLSFDPDSIFFDQIGGCLTRLCFNENHKHKNRPDIEATYRIENIRKIKSLLKDEQVISTEHIVDCFAAEFAFIHGCNTGCWISEFGFPSLYRMTFPETIISNRFLHDDREDLRSHLNNAFIYGLIFDSSVYRCRKATISDTPKYAAYVKELIDLKEKYHEFFYGGTFVCETEASLPKGIKMTEYKNGERHMFALWNNSDKEISFDFLGEALSMKAQTVTCAIR